MREDSFSFSYRIYSSINELNNADQKLYSAAIEARQKAYAPYSSYKVGASLLLSNGEVFTGNNQENIAYPSGLCAERVTIFAASAKYPETEFITLCIVADQSPGNEGTVISPCGACRQAIAEYEQLFDKPVRVLMGSTKGEILEIDGIKSLLPFMFFEPGLKKEIKPV